VLSYHFDPHRNPVDRPDRLVKTRELATLLEFYLDRAARYRTLDEDAEEEARFLLYTLEDGYRLDFTRSALIFDFGKTGTEPPEIENGIEYHRIGRDLVQQIIEAVSPKEESSSILEQEYDLPIEEPARSISDPQGQKSLLPKLNSAAFLGIQRDRSISWTELHTRRVLGDEQIDNAKPRNISQESVVQEQTGFGQVGDVLKEEDVSVSDTTRASEEAEEFHQQMPPSVKDITNLSESPEYDVLLGVTDPSPQYGLLGEVSGRKIAIDLNQTHTISLFGIQGGGKSYTLGTIAEMASILIPHINSLPQPLATVIFHYSRTMEYKPEFTSMVAPNSSKTEIQILSERYGATPMGLSDMVLLVPAEKLSERQVEYPGIQVVPLQFAAAELQASQWRFLMGAIGNQAAYIRQLNRMMRSLRGNLTLDSLREGVDGSSLPSHLKELASMRLDLAAEYIDDNSHLSSIIHPGRLIIVDLRDEFIEKDEALGLFVVLLQLFADAKHEGRSFNKLVVFDEAHKYIESSDLVAGLVEVVREMRHKGTSVMVASQDPPSVPVSLIELSTQIILHRFNSPAWLKHIQKANAALSDLTPEKMAHLGIGEAYIWSSKATDEAFTKGTVKVKCRPRVTLHGGGTKTAVDGGGLEAS
jgi:DNA phosphorothioation-dependent restriction protein DptH